MKQFKGFLLILALTSAGGHAADHKSSYTLTLLAKKFFRTSFDTPNNQSFAQEAQKPDQRIVALPSHYWLQLFKQPIYSLHKEHHISHTCEHIQSSIHQKNNRGQSLYISHRIQSSAHHHTDIIIALINLGNNTLVSASRDQLIIIWQLDEEANRKHSEKITAMAHPRLGHSGHHDGITCLTGIHQRDFASGSHDHTMIIWLQADILGTLFNLSCHKGHTSLIKGMTNLSKQPLISCDNTNIIAWQENSNNCWHIRQLINLDENDNPADENTDRLVFIKKIDDASFANGSYDCTAIIWRQQADGSWTAHERIGDINNLLVSNGHTRWVSDLCCLGESSIATASGDGIIARWQKDDTEIWQIVTKLGIPENQDEHVGHTGAITTLIQLSHDKIISSSWDRTLLVWQQNDDNAWRMHERIGSIKNDDEQIGHSNVITTCCKLNNRRLASASWDNSIIIWKKDDGQK
jgi:hypothetical protein